MFLLDTNVISELGRPSGKADPRVGAWSASTPQAVLHLSVITILEIEMGTRGVEHRNDHVQATRLRAWMGHVGSRSQAESSRLTSTWRFGARA
jgi:toxin FitB